MKILGQCKVKSFTRSYHIILR